MIEKKLGIAIAAWCVIALSVVLAGCAGAPTEQDIKSGWVGTWDLRAIDSNGTETTAENIEELKGLGLDVYLDLDAEGKASLVFFDESMDGTWEAQSATEATLSISDQPMAMVMENDQIALTQDNTVMTFVKGEARSAENADSASAAAAAVASTSAAASAASASASAGSASSSAAS